MLDGQRIRETFKTRPEAETRAQEIRAMRQHEGVAAFAPPTQRLVMEAQGGRRFIGCDVDLEAEKVARCRIGLPLN